jgi:hypothetical protein
MSPQLAIAIGVGGELVVTAGVVGAATLLLRLLGWLDSGGESGESDGGGGGGGDDRPPQRPPDGDGDYEPAWWPEFERQFAEHVDGSRPAPS